jgi:hypothetical protein
MKAKLVGVIIFMTCMSGLLFLTFCVGLEAVGDTAPFVSGAVISALLTIYGVITSFRAYDSLRRR